MASHLLLIAAIDFLFLVAAAGQYGDPNLASCSTTGNYTSGSLYMKNLVQLLAVLPVAASDDNGGFYKGSTGAGADQVFGLIMCFADTEAINCLDCLSGAPAGTTTACPGSGNAKAVYDACVLRYSAAPIPARHSGPRLRGLETSDHAPRT